MFFDLCVFLLENGGKVDERNLYDCPCFHNGSCCGGCEIGIVLLEEGGCVRAVCAGDGCAAFNCWWWLQG